VARPTVTLYGRPGCHLCDEARADLRRLRADVPFVLEERNIEADVALLRHYLERIPVIALDGEELYDFRLDVRDLRRRLGARVSREP
jgi:glutaredoxin